MNQIDSITNHTTFKLKSHTTSMILDRDKLNVNTLLQKMKKFSKYMHSEYACSGIRQFYVLFKMMMLIILRSRTAFFIQLVHHLVCGIGIGLIFHNTANIGERMFDHLKYCMGVVFFVCYTQVMVPILSCKYHN